MIRKLKSALLKAVGMGDPSHPLVRKYQQLRRTLFRKDRRIIDSYLESHRSPKLQIGASNHLLSGWLNTDLEPGDGVAFLDATKPFPLSSNCFCFIHAEHMIEHIPVADGVGMLRECHRILRPGGVVRIVTPNLPQIIGLYGSITADTQKQYLDWMAATFTPEAPEPKAVFVINTFFQSWGHRFLYDEATLRGVFRQAGFEDLRVCSLGQSDHSDLKGLENVHRYPPGLLEFESITLEGTKL